MKGSRRSISHKRPSSSIPFISDKALRIMAELLGPNVIASAGSAIPESLFLTSGNTLMHRCIKSGLKATIK